MHIEIVPLIAGILTGHIIYRYALPKLKAYFMLRGLRARLATRSTYFGPSPAKCYGPTPSLALHAGKNGVYYILRTAGSLFGFASGTVRNTDAGVDQIDADVAWHNSRCVAATLRRAYGR